MKRLGITVAILSIGLIAYVLWFILYHFIPIFKIVSNVEIDQKTKDLYEAGLRWWDDFCDIAWDKWIHTSSHWLDLLYNQTYDKEKRIWHLWRILVNLYWHLFLSEQEECLYTLQRYSQNTFSYITKIREYNGKYRLMRLGSKGNELNVREFILMYE